MYSYYFYSYRRLDKILKGCYTILQYTISYHTIYNSPLTMYVCIYVCPQKNKNSPILMKLGIPMFFGLPNPNLKLVFQNSEKGAPQGGGGGNLKIFYKIKIHRFR